MVVLRLVTALVAFLAVVPQSFSVAAPPPAPSTIVDREEAQLARYGRFVGRLLDDLTFDRLKIGEVTVFLDTELERVLPLEAVQRKEFYRTTGERYREYGDRISDAAAVVSEVAIDCREEDPRCGKPLEQTFLKLRDRNVALEASLKEVERKAEKEADRIIRIIERRIALQDVLRDLHERLEFLEMRPRDSERRDDERARARLKKEIELRRLDLLSLPEASEDLYRHFRVAVESVQGEIEWLEMKRDEYEALGAAAVILTGTSVNSKEEVSALRTLAGFYERGGGRLQRKIDQLERKQSDLSPAGTLRELDRSREMGDAWESLRQRYREQMIRYRQRGADYAADAVEAAR